MRGIHRPGVLTRRVVVVDLGTVDEKMLERLLVWKDGLIRESQELDMIVLERKVLVLLGKDSLDFLGVLVNGPAHHSYTEKVCALAVVSSVQIVFVYPVEVHLHQELRQILNLPRALQE